MSRPVGPYTPSVRAGRWVVCSGQIGLEEGVLVAGGVVAQARRALENVGGLLAQKGLSWADVVKTTVYLAAIDDYAVFNEVYADVLGEHRPARSVVAVAGLPLGALVEVEAWAYTAG